MKLGEITFTDGVPESEFSIEFVQGMAHRMAMSYFKYGLVSKGYPERVNAIESLLLRLSKYERTGNTEYLMDAANFAMIEFMRPRHPEAHFTPTDRSGSPGRVFNGEQDGVQDPNVPERMA